MLSIPKMKQTIKVIKSITAHCLIDLFYQARLPFELRLSATDGRLQLISSGIHTIFDGLPRIVASGLNFCKLGLSLLNFAF